MAQNSVKSNYIIPQRLVSLDAFRGFIMLCMLTGGLGFSATAERLSSAGNSSTVINFLAYQFSHVPYTGCSFWDLIQPAFIFIVGMAMPYSVSGRLAMGYSLNELYKHSLRRSAILVALGLFLSLKLIQPHPEFNWNLHNVLTQIGLGYCFVFFLVGKSLCLQLTFFAVILAGYWLAFMMWPIVTTVEYAESINAWALNTNISNSFDRFFLNLFPQPEVYEVTRNGYQTLNFVPSMATMLMGLMAAEYLRKFKKANRTLLTLVGSGAACVVVGYLLSQYACPLVKRLWTPSFTLFSGGLVILMFSLLYFLEYVLKVQGWEKPLQVFGKNPITLYLLYMLFADPATYVLRKLLPHSLVDSSYSPILLSLIVLGCLWAVAFEMDRRNIYVRV